MRALKKTASLALMGFDVDGVLTDGTLYFGPGGDELKAFSSLDGHGIKLLRQAGIEDFDDDIGHRQCFGGFLAGLGHVPREPLNRH